MVDTLHLLTAYAAKIGFEPALVDGADLLQKQCGVRTQHIGGYGHMYWQRFFRLLCGNSRDDGRWAVQISDIILKYQNFAVTAATMVVGLCRFPISF